MKLVAALGFAAAMLLLNDGVQAADHNEAPGTQMDPAADIADFYAWETADDKLVAAVTFAGLTEAGADPTYDPDVLYGIHIDNNDDNVADIDIWCRFGTNMAQDVWGVQCLNVPGAADADTNGEVGAPIDGGNGTMIFAGPREDPFFFDFEGFVNTTMTGDLMFDPARDSFAGTNVTAIVIEMDALVAAGEGTTLQIWATTGRI
ncbi:DUF4331 family protein [Enhygromyxa salina]|uniref:DUF4331 family protein n=1 Tax=Enhygromyxa salina TaxID=215803 RepID=UPI0015E791C6|nr:DUF4331 family protein [Enhygromyxa salina]